VLRQAVAGRIQGTTGFINELVRDDILRQKNLEIELTPLQQALWKRREEISPVLPQAEPPMDHEFISIKGAIEVFRTIVGTVAEEIIHIDALNSANNWRKAEISIAQTEIKRLQQCLSEQIKANVALERYSQPWRIFLCQGD
jgi:hypothetical protein